VKNNPIAAGGVGFAASFAAYSSPQLLVRALSFVAIGGIFGGAATAAPILIIGATGLFVSASAFHLFQAAKRSAHFVAGTPHKPKLATNDGSTWYH